VSGFGEIHGVDKVGVGGSGEGTRGGNIQKIPLQSPLKSSRPTSLSSEKNPKPGLFVYLYTSLSNV
jgi:hypothetical protein